jgi:glycerophosphoryl diester phosphodiesterase
MDDRPLFTVAHRAGNTAADLRAALDAGVDLVEADIHLYRDALEVRHRKAIGPHLYWEKWAEVRRRCDIHLPELTDVLGGVLAGGYAEPAGWPLGAEGRPGLMLDLKGPSLAVAAEVAALLRRCAPGAPVTVCTKQWRMLDAFDGEPHVRRVFSAANPVQLRRLRARLRGRRAAGVSIHRRLLTPDTVAELRRATDLVMVWPVDTEEALAHARWLGVTGVIGKNLTLLRRVAARPEGCAIPVPAGIISG